MLLQEFTDSSAISTVAFDKDESKMWLRFTTGHLYEYRGVNQQVVMDLMQAPSKGVFYHENIKDKYESEKVEE